MAPKKDEKKQVEVVTYEFTQAEVEHIARFAEYVCENYSVGQRDGIAHQGAVDTLAIFANDWAPEPIPSGFVVEENGNMKSLYEDA